MCTTYTDYYACGHTHSRSSLIICHRHWPHAHTRERGHTSPHNCPSCARREAEERRHQRRWRVAGERLRTAEERLGRDGYYRRDERMQYSREDYEYDYGSGYYGCGGGGGGGGQYDGGFVNYGVVFGDRGGGVGRRQTTRRGSYVFGRRPGWGWGWY